MKKYGKWIVRILLTALTAATVTFIFCHSAVDAEVSTEQSDAAMGWIDGILRCFGIEAEMSELVIRKLAHFIEYFVLGILLSLTAYAYVRRRGRMLLIALPAGLAIAVIDELIQLGSEGRACEVRDMLLDYCAVLTASLMIMLILYLTARRREKKQIRKEGT